MQEVNPQTSSVRFPAPVNDQWDYLLSTIWSQMLHMVIAFEGHLDQERLYRAFCLVMDAEPLLASRFMESRAPFWETIPDLPRNSIFSFVHADDAERALQRILTNRVDPAEGPQGRISVIRGRHDCLVISVNHAVSDAFGVKHITRLLIQAYRGLWKDPGFTLPTKVSRDRSFHPIVASFTPQEISAARDACGEQSAVWGIPLHIGMSRCPAYRVKIIEPHLFLKLKEYSHSRGITINDLLLSSYFAALFSEIPHSPGCQYPVLTSVDLRRILPEYDAPPVANLSVAFEVRVSAETPQEYPLLIERVHRAMADKKRMYAGLGAAIWLQEDFSGGFYTVKNRLREMEQRTFKEHYPKNPFFSNTGIIPDDSADFEELSTVHAFLAPPVDYPPGFGVTASTFRNRLTLVSGFCEDSVPDTIVEGIFSRMEEHLVSLVGE